MTIIEGRACAEFKASCNFCKKDLTLYVDYSYDGLRDPMGLVRMAACNRCGDYRSARSKVEDAIAKLCCQIPLTKDSAVLSKMRESLIRFSSAYARALCAYLESSRLYWTEELGASIYTDPSNWPKILKDYRTETFNKIKQEETK